MMKIMHSGSRNVPVLSLCVCGLACGLATGSATAQFTSLNVELRSHIDLSELGSSGGNDCWGYVSPSGREYALMGVRTAMVVVEITDPVNPVIIGSIGHFDSLWGDIKTYQSYAYVVNESGGGIDVVDLSDVDNGNVTLVQSVTANGLSDSHDVAIDTVSGFLYLLLPNINGGRLVAYDLSDPANPTLVGQMTSGNGGGGLHDAQIVTFTSGPNAGKQICFGAAEGNGLDIIDVTDKSNMFRISRTAYAAVSYAHQCWLSEDRQLLYLNDELDSINRTIVFDVSDLANPVVVNEYGSGVTATDHNLYVHDGFIFEAEYRAGLRIFCAADPVNPVQVGWFDTFPENDSGGFDGAWSVYPFFPSGTVIVSDITRGLFILDPTAALTAGALIMSYESGRPDLIDPDGGTTMTVTLDASCGAVLASGTVMLHVDAGAGFVTIPMTEQGGGVFSAVFPAAECGQAVQYFVSADSTGGGTFTDPINAPATTYVAVSATGQTVTLSDDFEADLGWTTEILGATSGDWQRGVPVDDDGWDFDPPADSDGSGKAYVTQNTLGNTDVDDGAVRLISPLLDLSGDNSGLSYDYYLRLTDEAGLVDALVVEISENGDAGPWIEIARHDSNGGLFWRNHQVTPVDLQNAGVTVTDTMKVRLTANDADPQSIVEAGLDAFKVIELQCDTEVVGDLDGDGVVGIIDFLALLADWGQCDEPCPPSCLADLDDDCTVGITDFLLLLGNWG